MLLLLLACTSPDDASVDTSPEDTGPDDTGPGDTGPDDTGPDDTDGDGDQEILAVSGYWSGAVHLFDLDTLEPVGALEAPGAQTVVPSPDGTWLACAEEVNELRRFDPATLALLGTFTTGGFDGPTSVAWGPDGDLYVASFEDDRVVRYAPDGSLRGDFVASGAGGLDGPDIGMAFGPDGRLYVPGWYSRAVHVYDADGAWVEDAFTEADGLSGTRGIAFDAEGGVYVTGNGTGAILHRGADGLVAAWAEVRQPTGLHHHVASGRMLVASDALDNVRAFDEAAAPLGILLNDDAIDGATALTVLSRPR